MPSIVLLAIGLAVAVALVGSVAIQTFGPSGGSNTFLMERCQQIANDGYNMQLIYPVADPADLPADERQQFEDLNQRWMDECVAVLPLDKIMQIVDSAERNPYRGE